MPRLIDDMEIGLSVRYLVSIDDQTLGNFTNVEGLDATIEMETYQEGGNNEMTWQFPKRMTYGDVTLSRPLGPDTRFVAGWISSIIQGYAKKNAVIVAMNGLGIPIAQWGLLHVLPKKWTGPSLDPDQPKLLQEKLVIVHEGFFSLL